MENEKQKFMRSTELLRSFWDVQKNIVRLVQRTAVENGLSMPQLSILWTIAPQKRMTQKNIGEKAYIPKSTLSQAVDGLVQDGLLNRRQVEGNRREVLLAISEKGIALLKNIHQQEHSIHIVFQEIVESMGEKEYEDLVRTHTQITNYLESREEQGDGSK